MNARRGDPEEALHIGFGWGACVEGGVGVDEGEVLPLTLGELATRHGRLSMITFEPGAQMNIRYMVELTPEEEMQLREIVNRGHSPVRRVKRAQILLAADARVSDESIACTISVGTSTVFRTPRRYVEGGVEHALSEQPRAGRERKLSGEEEALLVAITCSHPPTGRRRWTLELLAGELVRRTEHEAISPETIRRRLAEQQLKPWQKRMWCIRAVNAGVKVHHWPA